MNPKGLQNFPRLKAFNFDKKKQIHKWIKNNRKSSDENKGYPQTFEDNISFYDCHLFPWKHMPQNFQESYTSAILDKKIQTELERSRALNWCKAFVTMVAVAVSTGGNCLLHAVSLAVWAVEDEHHMLRELLLQAISANSKNSYKHRWWRQRLLDLKALESGSEIVEEEWNKVVRSISSLDAKGLTTVTAHRLLESIHIYILANILRRPIIIVASGHGLSASTNFQDSHLAGIYLPLEWLPLKCCKTPIILGYSQGHFCPLLAEMELRHDKDALVFPLVTHNFSSLPVRFLSVEEEQQASELIQRYFLIREIGIPTNGSMAPVPCATLQQQPLPVEHDQILQHFKHCENLSMSQSANTKYRISTNAEYELQRLQENQQTKVVSGPRSQESLAPAPTSKCVMRGCNNEGSISQENLCSTCLKNFTIAESGNELLSIGEGQNRTFMLKQNSPDTTNLGLGLSLSDLENTLPQTRNFSPHQITPTAPVDLTEREDSQPQLSMMEERCHNGCGYRCSRNTYPYCHECYNANQQTMPPQQRTNLNLPIKAPFNDINNPIGDLMIFSPTPSGAAAKAPTLVTPQQNVQGIDKPTYLHIPNEGEKVHRDVTHRDINRQMSTESYPSCSESKNFCRTVNYPQQTSVLEQEKHDERYNQLQKYNLRQVEHRGLAMAEQRQSADEEVIEVSQEVTRSECASPFCKKLITGTNKLCEACTRMLRNAQRQHSSSGQQNEMNAAPTRDWFSYEARNQGYQAIVQHGRKQEKKRGEKCITPLCANFGDPANAYMCSSCYAKSREEYVKLRRENKRQQATQMPTSPTVGWGAMIQSPVSQFGATNEAQQKSTMVTSMTRVNPRGNSMHLSLEDLPTRGAFTMEYDKFAAQTKVGAKKCNVGHCSNYGNASKSGLCNSCHAELARRRHIAIYGENVPDCYSTQQNSI